MLEINKVYCMDALEGLRQLGTERVDLIITSPPYNAGKDYGEYDDNISLDEWLSLIKKVLVESYRVLSLGSRACFNLPWGMFKKPRVFVPHLVACMGEEIGFYLREWITWDKGVATSTAWGTWLSPSGPVLRCRCEPILVFQKGLEGKKRISGAGRGLCVKGDITPREFLEYTENVWNIRGVTQDIHPAMFPIEIPSRLIKLYTWKGDLVVDPFMGVGTTALACKRLERKFVGFDIDSGYVNIAIKQLVQSQLREYCPQNGGPENQRSLPEIMGGV